MLGLGCSLAAFSTAHLVARREPAHRPIRDALGVAAWYALAVTVDHALRPNDPSPRAELLLWALVAVASGWAYLRAFAPSDSDPRWERAGILILAPLAFAGRSWSTATWGPFVMSTAIGGGVTLLWFLRGERASIVQRVALALLVSDVCMLAFVPWPGVQIWQGRASALIVTGMQIAWLTKPCS